LTSSLGSFLEPWWSGVKTGSFEFLRISVQRSIFPFYDPLPADDSFFWVLVLPKRFLRMML
jgi:hypothetical protein